MSDNINKIAKIQLEIEKDFQKLIEIVKKTSKKTIEIQKGINVINDGKTLWQIGIKYHYDELKKKLLNIDSVHDVFVDVMDKQTKFNEEIAELHNLIDKGIEINKKLCEEIAELKITNKERWQLIKIQNDINLKNKEKIAKLKEQIEYVFLRTEELNAEDLNNKAILQDFMTRVGGLGGWNFDYFKKKLDSSKTEKKEVRCPNCKRVMFYYPYFGETGKYVCYKCSEGEKMGVYEGVRRNPIIQTPDKSSETDSKSLEPYIKPIPKSVEHVKMKFHCRIHSETYHSEPCCCEEIGKYGKHSHAPEREKKFKKDYDSGTHFYGGVIKKDSESEKKEYSHKLMKLFDKQEEALVTEKKPKIIERIDNIKEFLHELIAEIFIFQYPNDQKERNEVQKERYTYFTKKLQENYDKM